MKRTVVKTALTVKDKAKIKSDLKILKKFLSFSKLKNYRPMITGGYGLDGILGEITRPHNDLDVVIYCENKREAVIEELCIFIRKIFTNPQIKISSNQFMHVIDINAKCFGGNIPLLLWFATF